MAVSFSRGLSTVLLTLALAAGQIDVCAGWMPTPEARMACCSGEGPCPMHKADSRDGSTRAVTQAEADRCCAASEHEDATPSPSTAAFSVTLTAALAPIPALLPGFDAHPHIRRASVPIPALHVPRHILLSVFLV